MKCRKFDFIGINSHFYRSVEECRIRVSALEGRVASIDNDVGNQVTIDCKRSQPGLKLNEYKKNMSRHRNKVQHYQSSGGHFGWAEEHYRGEQKTKTFE